MQSEDTISSHYIWNEEKYLLLNLVPLLPAELGEQESCPLVPLSSSKSPAYYFWLWVTERECVSLCTYRPR